MSALNVTVKNLSVIQMYDVACNETVGSFHT